MFSVNSLMPWTPAGSTAGRSVGGGRCCHHPWLYGPIDGRRDPRVLFTKISIKLGSTAHRQLNSGQFDGTSNWSELTGVRSAAQSNAYFLVNKTHKSRRPSDSPGP